MFIYTCEKMCSLQLGGVFYCSSSDILEIVWRYLSTRSLQKDEGPASESTRNVKNYNGSHIDKKLRASTSTEFSSDGRAGDCSVNKHSNL